jgi:hypothetical protein
MDVVVRVPPIGARLIQAASINARRHLRPSRLGVLLPSFRSRHCQHQDRAQPRKDNQHPQYHTHPLTFRRRFRRHRNPTKPEFMLHVHFSTVQSFWICHPGGLNSNNGDAHGREFRLLYAEKADTSLRHYESSFYYVQLLPAIAILEDSSHA